MPRLAVEPGRAIAGPGTVTLYEVGTIKAVELDGGARRARYVTVDGGMSDNIRTALYDARLHLRARLRELATRRRCSCRVVGKHCESGDIVVRDCWLPADVAPGDLLAVAATGAYCWSMASNYNYLPAPAGGRRAATASATEIVRRRDLSDVARPRRRPRRRARRRR